MKHEEMARKFIKDRFMLEPSPLLVEVFAKALAQVEAETLERAEQAIRELRESHQLDTGECGAGTPCDYVAAWETAEETIRSLSPNNLPTPTKSVVPEGWVMVPREPTDEQIRAGCAVIGLNYENYSEWMAKHYRAMIQAAPDTDVSVSGGLIDKANDGAEGE